MGFSTDKVLGKYILIVVIGYRMVFLVRYPWSDTIEVEGHFEILKKPQSKAVTTLSYNSDGYQKL